METSLAGCTIALTQNLTKYDMIIREVSSLFKKDLKNT